MEKRLPLALFLSLLVLFAWSLCHPRTPPPPPDGDPAGVAGEAAPDAPADPADELTPRPDVAAETEETLELVLGEPGEPGWWWARFTNRGARLAELRVGGFVRDLELRDDEVARLQPDAWPRLVVPVETAGGRTGSLDLRTHVSSRDLAPGGLEDALWAMEPLPGPDGEPAGVEFRYGPGTGVTFVKRIERVPGTWRLRLTLAIENAGGAAGGPRSFVLTPAGCVPEDLGDRFYTEPRAVAVGSDDGELEIEWEDAESARDEAEPLDVPLPIVVAGAHNKYFALLLRGADEAALRTIRSAVYRGVRDEAWLAEHPGEAKEAWRYVATDLIVSLDVPDPGETATWTYDVYAGPKDPDLMVADHPAHAAVLEGDLSGWSIFSSIGKVLLRVLRVFHELVGNWGVAIILLTVCVRLVLFPLNRRSQTSMARYQAKMKRVQPKLEEIKKRHEGNPQKLREAQARLMQEEGAFPPLGGCLPIFIQIPIFFGLFAALRTAFDLRHAPFALWIDDLSQPDRLLRLDLPLPLVGTIEYLNLLPILMVVLWVLQQMGMPKPADEQAARMQRMMMFMPVVMGLFLYNYAAGLSLYMITQSTLGIFEQRVIKKLWPIDEAEPEPKRKKGAGCGPFSGVLQNIAEKQQAEMKRLEAMRRGQTVPRRGGEKALEKRRRRRL